MTCGFELVDHLPYSPDLAPSDYFLFPNLAWKQYWTDDEVISAVEGFFEDQDESFYTTGIKAAAWPCTVQVMMESKFGNVWTTK